MTCLAVSMTKAVYRLSCTVSVTGAPEMPLLRLGVPCLFFQCQLPQEWESRAVGASMLLLFAVSGEFV